MISSIVIALILAFLVYLDLNKNTKASTVPSQPTILSAVAIENPGIMIRIKTPAQYGEGYFRFTGYEFFLYNNSASEYNVINNYIMGSAYAFNFNETTQQYDLPFNVKYIDDADNEVSSTNSFEKNNQEILIKFKDPIIKSMNIGTYYIKYRVKNASNQFSDWSEAQSIQFDGFRNKYGDNITADALRNECYDYNWLDTNISDACKQYVWNDVGCFGEADPTYVTNHSNSTLRDIYDDFSKLSAKTDDTSINLCRANQNDASVCLKSDGTSYSLDDTVPDDCLTTLYSECTQPSTIDTSSTFRQTYTDLINRNECNVNRVQTFDNGHRIDGVGNIVQCNNNYIFNEDFSKCVPHGFDVSSGDATCNGVVLDAMQPHGFNITSNSGANSLRRYKCNNDKTITRVLSGAPVDNKCNLQTVNTTHDPALCEDLYTPFNYGDARDFPHIDGSTTQKYDIDGSIYTVSNELYSPLVTEEYSQYIGGRQVMKYNNKLIFVGKDNYVNTLFRKLRDYSLHQLFSLLEQNKMMIVYITSTKKWSIRTNPDNPWYHFGYMLVEQEFSDLYSVVQYVLNNNISCPDASVNYSDGANYIIDSGACVRTCKEGFIEAYTNDCWATKDNNVANVDYTEFLPNNFTNDSGTYRCFRSSDNYNITGISHNSFNATNRVGGVSFLGDVCNTTTGDVTFKGLPSNNPVLNGSDYYCGNQKVDFTETTNCRNTYVNFTYFTIPNIRTDDINDSSKYNYQIMTPMGEYYIALISKTTSRTSRNISN